MEELAKFTIGNKAVVGFVSQAGTVGGQLVVLRKRMIGLSFNIFLLHSSITSGGMLTMPSLQVGSKIL